MDYRVDINTNTTLIRWIGNGMVQALSAFVEPQLGDEIQRWSSKEKKSSFCALSRNHQCNKDMGAVDLCEIPMPLYHIELGSKKWYKILFITALELQS